jgi:RHS repeat-associated protein
MNSILPFLPGTIGFDQINSNRIITNDNGNVVFSETYGPYGDVQKTWTNIYNPKLKFSWKEREGYSDLDYFGARYYDHKSHRFVSVDPIINKTEALVNPQLWNLYAYCRNNPVTHFDPDGRLIFIAPWLLNPATVTAIVAAATGGAILTHKIIKSIDITDEDVVEAIEGGVDIVSKVAAPTSSIASVVSKITDIKDYPDNPDDLVLPDDWYETEAGDRTGGRHRIWKGPNGEVIRWDKEGRRGSPKKRGPHYHDDRFPGKHIEPGTNKKDLENNNGG